MAFTRTRETLGLVLLAAALLLAPAPLEGQRYLRQLAGIDSRTPPAPAAVVEAEEALRDSIVVLARAQVGRRYRWGGERPEEGFDCSGLVRYIMSALDFSLPRTAALQARTGREVPKDLDELQPGDLLTFGRGSRITHIGIYVGDGRIIHASSGAGRVVESPPIRSWRGVRRLFGGGEREPEAPGPRLSAGSLEGVTRTDAAGLPAAHVAIPRRTGG